MRRRFCLVGWACKVAKRSEYELQLREPKWFRKIGCYISLTYEISFINLFGFSIRHDQTPRYAMVQSASIQKPVEF